MMSSHAHTPLISSGAVFSEDRKYRYRLWRVWDEELPRVLFVMLNPSIADEQREDPTLRRCLGFARSWGFGGLYVGNLFAYVSSRPDDLFGAGDPLGRDNNDHLSAMISECSQLICAWGNAPVIKRLGGIPDWKVLRQAGLYCIRRSKNGFPCHPLYQAITSFPLPYAFNSERTVH